ncbi:ribonuclease H-like domain-containing protein [Tanacetum coccineum]
MSSGGTKNTGNTRKDEGGHPDDSEPAEAVSDIEENETLVESDKESEGDDSFYQEFNEMFKIPSVIPDCQSEVNLRRSSRKTKPKTFDEASKDIRWIEAMNLEMEALNKNWLGGGERVRSRESEGEAIGRKPIGNKWVWKVKYKSTGDVERFKARCILSLAVFNNWSVYQLDINNAFLYGDLEEDVTTREFPFNKLAVSV